MNKVPFSVVHERAFISCIMQDPCVCGEKAKNVFGGANPCYTPECTIVYDAVLAIDTHKLDLMVIMDYLSNGQQASLIGPSELRGLINEVPSTANFTQYIFWVSKLYQQRKVLGVLDDMQTALIDPRAKLDDIVDSSELAIRTALSVSGTQTVVSASDAAKDAQRGLDEEIEAIRLHLPSVDRLIGDVPLGSVCILAARPGCGKTTLAGHIALSHAGMGNPVYFASMEMPRRQLMNRWVCSLTDTYSSSLRAPERREIINKGFDMLGGLPLFIDDKAGLTISEFIRKCKRLKAEHNIGVAVLDYLQRMDLEDRKGETRDQTVSRAAKQIKDCMLEQQMVCLLLAQLNRAAADGAPSVHHLRESGGLEQEADYVFLLNSQKHTPEQLRPINMGDVAQDVDLIVGKNRHGPQGVEKIKWWKPFGRFEAPVIEDEYIP